MIKKTLILLVLVCLSGCSIASLENRLNYEKTLGYSFKYYKGSHSITATKENGNHISIAFGKGSSCGQYGLIGPLIFPIIPIWENRDCGDVVILIGATKNVYVIYRDKIYEPSEISKTGYYTFPLQTKSITDTAILAVEKKDGQKFEIPFRYQHTFSFDLWPGR
jgi:hypothetical protein